MQRTGNQGRFEPENYREIWRGVIEKAFLDSGLVYKYVKKEKRLKRKTIKRDLIKRKAITWLKFPTEDSLAVCEMAELDNRQLRKVVFILSKKRKPISTKKLRVVFDKIAL